MSQDPADCAEDRDAFDTAKLFAGCDELVQQLYTQSGSARWGLARESFASTLARSLQKRFASERVTPAKLQEFLSTLHIEDLALASACAEGCEAAWEYFVATFRSYMRAAACAVLRCPSGAPEASELADSLFAELYGIAEGKAGRRSLLRYFHGRSSLRTWLRAVLAQRHIDSIRIGRRFASLDGGQTLCERIEAPPGALLDPPVDPHRKRYLALFGRALDAALRRLEPRDSDRLRFYYAEELTLAEIGRRLGEHESSVSRNLERIRKELRTFVEETLRQGRAPLNGSGDEPGLSDPEIALCFEYAASEAPIDLDALFPRKSKPGSPAGRTAT